MMRMKKGFPGSIAAVATAATVFVCSGVLATSGAELESFGFLSTFAEQEAEGEGGTAEEQTPERLVGDARMAENEAARGLTIVDHDEEGLAGKQPVGFTGLAGMDALTDGETSSKETEERPESEVETSSEEETETEPGEGSGAVEESETESPEAVSEKETTDPDNTVPTETGSEIEIITEAQTEAPVEIGTEAEPVSESASEEVTETVPEKHEPETDPQVSDPGPATQEPAAPGPDAPEPPKPEEQHPSVSEPGQNKSEPKVLGPIPGEPKNYMEMVGDSLRGIMTPNPYAIAEESINVRSGPGLEYPVIGKLYKGASGQCVQSSNGWHNIRSGNVDGWVSAPLVVTGLEAAHIVIECKYGYLTGRVETETLNIRSTPELGENLLGQVYAGNYVVINDLRPDGWCNITSESGVTGFVSSSFLSSHYVMKSALTIEEEAAWIAEQARIARDNATAQAIYASAATGGCSRSPVILSYDDAYLIGCVCEMEAGYVDYSIRLAIANIIINRYLSGIWGYSIPGVVYAPGQFNGASTAYTPSPSTMQAVYDALAGHNNAGGYMYYCTLGAMERVNHGPGTILGPMFMYEPGWIH